MPSLGEKAKQFTALVCPFKVYNSFLVLISMILMVLSLLPDAIKSSLQATELTYSWWG